MKARFLPLPSRFKRRLSRTPLSRVITPFLVACCLMMACGCQAPATSRFVTVIATGTSQASATSRVVLVEMFTAEW